MVKTKKNKKKKHLSFPGINKPGLILCFTESKSERL